MSGIPSLSSSGSSASGIPVKNNKFIFRLEFGFYTIVVIVQINGVINSVRIRITGLDINKFLLEEENCLWPTSDLAMSSMRMMTAERRRMKESESLMVISDVRSQVSRVWLTPVNTPHRITAALWPRLTDSCVIIGDVRLSGSEFLNIAF